MVTRQHVASRGRRGRVWDSAEEGVLSPRDQGGPELSPVVRGHPGTPTRLGRGGGGGVAYGRCPATHPAWPEAPGPPPFVALRPQRLGCTSQPPQLQRVTGLGRGLRAGYPVTLASRRLEASMPISLLHPPPRQPPVSGTGQEVLLTRQELRSWLRPDFQGTLETVQGTGWRVALENSVRTHPAGLSQEVSGPGRGLQEGPAPATGRRGIPSGGGSPAPIPAGH